MKLSMMTAPVSKTFDPQLETRIETHASGVGVSVILEQNHAD